jgi:hypothetical protein
VVDFFALSNPQWLAIGLAIAFEVGAAASLASIIALQKMNKTIVWGLFILLTAMQAMGNTYYAYSHLRDYQGWIELFGLVDEELIYQKRVLGIVSGAILPVVALGFIKALVDYIKPTDDTIIGDPNFIHADNQPITKIIEQPKIGNVASVLEQSIDKIPEPIEYPEYANQIGAVEPTIVEDELTQNDQIVDEPQLNNNNTAVIKDRTVDELVSRGERAPELVLKKPHDQ